MVFSDPQGQIYDHPSLYMAAQSGRESLPGNADELTPLSEGCQLFSLPGRYPVGWDPETKNFVTVEETVIDGRRVECTAVAAFLAPGYLRFLLPATHLKEKYPILPLWAYGAVGWRENGPSGERIRIRSQRSTSSAYVHVSIEIPVAGRTALDQLL